MEHADRASPAGAECRRVRLFAVVSVVLLTATGVVRWWAPSPFAPRVNVRWSEAVSDVERADIEHHLALTAGQRLDGMTWAYDLSDPSPAIVKSIVEHAAVEDTHHIDRGEERVSAGAPRGTSRLELAGPAGWVHSGLLTSFMLFCFTSFVVSGAWLASAGQAGRFLKESLSDGSDNSRG